MLKHHKSYVSYNSNKSAERLLFGGGAMELPNDETSITESPLGIQDFLIVMGNMKVHM